MDLTRRRFVGGLIRIGLVVLAFRVAGSWVFRRVPHRPKIAHIQREAPPVEALGAGDLRIYSIDSTVDVVLRGNELLTGLSPKTVAKVRAEVDKSTARETTGLGGSIAQIVKTTVAGAIGTHVDYSIAEIRDVRFDAGRIIIELARGGETQLFGNTRVNHNDHPLFREEDVKRLADAIRARQHELPRP